MPGIASAATAVVIGSRRRRHVHDPRRRRRHHAAESRAARHRRTVRHARVAAIPGGSISASAARPAPTRRPTRALRRGRARRGGRVPAGRGGAAGVFPRGATGAGGARGSGRGTEGADLAPRVEPVQCAARGRARPAVRVCVALRAGSPDGRAAGVPQRVPAVGRARPALRDGRGATSIAADTDEEARRLFTSPQQQWANRFRGRAGLLPAPVDEHGGALVPRRKRRRFPICSHTRSWDPRTPSAEACGHSSTPRRRMR